MMAPNCTLGYMFVEHTSFLKWYTIVVIFVQQMKKKKHRKAKTWCN